MRTNSAAFFGLDGDALDRDAFFGHFLDGITNDDIGIDIGEGILDFAHCCSSSFVEICFRQKII